nr:UDP-N-acetylmuramoyl-L-alanyl-D-glutamate--2,6-diaminopimelate ligase [uncultured Peptostreptococcus sp.]
MKLSELLAGLDYISNRSQDQLKECEIDNICYDSRKASQNGIFVAIKGETVDGHDYIDSAYQKGCRVFVVNDNMELAEDATMIIVDDSRNCLSHISANFFGNPSRDLKVVGVTGTKGKTTITNYLRTVLTKSGLNTGVIGTNGVFYNDYAGKTINTTPESYELHKTIREMVDAGVKCLAMEVSSGGLMMERVNHIDFDIGIYTNLSPDHIGPKEHPTFEDYRNCKSRLFSLCRHGIINLDDDHAAYMIDKANCDIETFSIKADSDYRAQDISLTRTETSLGVDFDYVTRDGQTTRTHIASPGEFSVYNALAVIAAANYLSIDKDKMLLALSTAQVDGRVQVLPSIPNITVVLDYAHNGVSLENVLETLLKYQPKRLICVFGSIGGRAALRRKELGDVAARLCDVSILTTDNPDDEDPMDIINDIGESFVDSKCQVYKIVDRPQAILKGIEIAKPGDMVVVAGKGHEKYQIIKGQRVFYDEKAEVLKAIEIVKNR